ncbi:MAG: NAD(P)/FAD-dependent oxidoreductase [Chloroflexi bacterium]|nr:NAD(P)/FAD-dependent oxidoreductase [Chloroflexota bacterium]
MEKTYDIIIIGAGPNGLEAGAYLARAGLKVLLLEARHEVGGGLATEEVTLGGFMHNTHAVYMMMADYAPVYQDFKFEEQYLCKHIYPSLQFAMPLSDGKSLCLYSDLEKSVASIARFSKKDAESYRELYHKCARAVEDFIAPATFAPPLPALDQMVKLQSAGVESVNWMLEASEKTPKELIEEHFENPHVRALMLYVATHWGVDYDQAGLGYLVLLYLNRATNYRLVQGGSHRAAQALHKAIHERQGVVLDNEKPRRLIIEGGKATGIELHDGTVVKAGKAIISTTDPKETFLNLVGEKDLDKDFADSVKGWQWEKHSLFTTSLALAEAPSFTAAASNPDLNKAFVYVLGYEDPETLMKDYDLVDNGEVSPQAAFNCCFPTVHDPIQAPKGRHTGIISRFAPYNLKDGGPDRWYSISYKEQAAQSCLETLRQYAPNMTPDKVLWKYICTPVDLPNKFLDMVQGSFKQGQYHPLQMGYLRPNEQCSNARTPIKNLYVGGSSNYPGGCVIWGAGYLAANAVADDLGIQKWWQEPAIVTKAKKAGLL